LRRQNMKWCPKIESKVAVEKGHCSKEPCPYKYTPFCLLKGREKNAVPEMRTQNKGGS